MEKRTKFKWLSFMVLFGLLFGFNGSAEALTGSIIDTFIDESMIAFKEDIVLDTVAGEAKTPTYSWSYTFSYSGNNYAAYSGSTYVSWNTMIPGYSASYTNPANGNTGTKGQNWCNNVFITSGWQNNFDDWFIANINELNATSLTSWSSTTCPGSNYQRACVNPGDYWPKGASDWLARPVRIITVLQGNLVSTNLLTGETVDSIDSFGYDVASIPTGTGLKVQFSQDNTNWYNASGLLGGWDSLSVGSNTIDLSLLGWSGDNFYYQMEFSSDALIAYAPVLDEISVNYSSGVIPEPASLLLLSFGVVGLVGFGRLKKQR